MNLYDTKPIYCARCENSIGEVEWDSKIINPLCGKCANPMPEGDKILYVISNFQSQSNKHLVPPLIAEA